MHTYSKERALSSGETLRRYDFLTREREVAALLSLTPEDVRAWFSAHLDASSPSRRKLAVHVLPRAAGCPAAAPPPKLLELPLPLPTQPGDHSKDSHEAGLSHKAAGPQVQKGGQSNGKGPREVAGQEEEGSRTWLVPDLVQLKSSLPLWTLPRARLPPQCPQ